jgi:sarcosine oxidase/L-pipecolate oxidase
MTIPHPEDADSAPITVSLPRTKHDEASLEVPAEGLAACREFLAKCIPDLATRPWTCSRVCWYTDTKNGDWLVAYHPRFPSLFVATGGSGHAYKFLPILGERVVQTISRKFRGDHELDENDDDELGRELQSKWAWPERDATDHVYTVDRRGGRRGMLLDEELRKVRTNDEVVRKTVAMTVS